MGRTRKGRKDGRPEILFEPAFPLDQLKPRDDNPNVMNDQQRAALDASLSKFGVVQPIVALKDGTMVGGHQRRDSELRRGNKTGPVFFIDVGPDAAQELMLALNHVHGDPIKDKLTTLVNSLARSPEGDLTVTGFTAEQIGDLLKPLSGVPFKPIVHDPNKRPKTGTNIPRRVKPGDVWGVGPHRLICADTADHRAYERLLGPQRIDLVVTSPPYLLGKEFEVTTSVPQLKVLMGWVATNTYAHAADLAYFFLEFGNVYPATLKKKLHHDGYLAPIFHDSIVEGGWTWQSERWWHKITSRNSTPQYTLNTTLPHFGSVQHLWTFKKGTKGEKARVRDVSRRAIWDSDLQTMVDPWQFSDRPLSLHPGAFPVVLPMLAIKVYTDPGAAVLDPFVGSGSTVVAAERTGRVGWGIDRDARYLDTALARLEALMDVKPELVSRGKKGEWANTRRAPQRTIVES